jgi:NTP pyrophosphatase (non-canonical NTP hydrolase)
LEILARLTEENGELARELNHRYGAKRKKATEDDAEVADEIADILFTLCCLANSLDISLDEAWERCMNKVHKRDTSRFQEPVSEPLSDPRHLW